MSGPPACGTRAAEKRRRCGCGRWSTRRGPGSPASWSWIPDPAPPNGAKAPAEPVKKLPGGFDIDAPVKPAGETEYAFLVYLLFALLGGLVLNFTPCVLPVISLKVMSFIVDRQRDFFEKGVEHLRPLTLREVAEHIDMHESTVSRVTNDKYVQTPRGVLPLKFFFSSGLSTDYGEDVSARGIRARIQKLVADEDVR